MGQRFGGLTPLIFWGKLVPGYENDEDDEDDANDEDDGDDGDDEDDEDDEMMKMLKLLKMVYKTNTCRWFFEKTAPVVT